MIFATVAYFILRGRDTQICVLWLLFLMGMVCPLMRVVFSLTPFEM